MSDTSRCMCGILGCYKKSEDTLLSEDELAKALSIISHRGPDAIGTYISKKVGIALGHTRLSIQDLSSHGNQPMHSSDASCTIIFNGEIYNFLYLREYLDKDINFSWQSDSDTEVILNSYISSRRNNVSLDSLFSSLNGIFSLAIWDSKTEQLILARDAFGVKPLYYSQNESGFFFSSEIKAFSKLGVNISEINPVAVDRHLSYIWSPGKETIASSIFKLGPGELMIIKDGKIQSHRNWYIPSYSRGLTKISNRTDSIQLCRKYLRKAVHRQLISDVPLGAFLSGGLDSSSIVAFAKEKIPNIQCFTILSKIKTDNDGFADDYPYAKKVARKLEVPLEVVEFSNEDLAQNLEEMVYQLDEPLADPACMSVLMISKIARKNGIKVLLSGTGGDDIFTGYRRHLALTNEYCWSWLPFSTRKLINHLSLRLPKNNAFTRRLAKLFSGAHLSSDNRLLNYFRWINESELNNIYDPIFKQRLESYSSVNPIAYFLNRLPKKLTRLEKMLAIEQRFFLTEHNLLYTDKMSMQAGIEVRVPFLDKELVDFAFKISDRYKQRGSTSKWILKKAMEPYLPKDIIYRPKTGFGVPLRRWLKYELRDWLYEILSESNLNKFGLFNPQSVTQLVKDNELGKIDASYTLLSIATIQLWCSRYL